MCCDSVKYYTISTIYWGPQSWWTPQSHISWLLFHLLCSPYLHFSHLWSSLHQCPLMSSIPSDPSLWLFVAFQCPLIALGLWHSHPKQSASISLFSNFSSPKVALAFPSISDLPETVGTSLLLQMYHPYCKDTLCHLHAEMFLCGCHQIKFIVIGK